MDVVNDNAALLSNFEVFSVLRERFRNRQKHKSDSGGGHLATITYETLRYLEKTPCRTQSEAIVGNFRQAMKPFGLMKAETLQLLNLRPTSDVVLYLLVEEIDSRMNLEELLNVVTASLPDDSETTDAGVGQD